jgi:peptide chain release factor 1
MLRHVIPRFSSRLDPRHFEWLNTVSFKHLFLSPSAVQIRHRVFGGGISESILDSISGSVKKISDLEILLKDKSMADIRELVESEIESETDSIATESEKLRALALSELDSRKFFEEDKLNARIEVRAGVGGDEALKWAHELFDMYTTCAMKMGFTIEPIDSADDTFRAIVSGNSSVRGPYGWFRYESGVHRVQRVPFNSDRMQTSAAAVVVMPKIDLPEIKIKDADLKISISKKSSGAGGQSVNAAYQQVTMKHLPTGYTVTVADSHAQQENREIAYMRIQKRVQEMEEEKIVSAMTRARKSQIKTADRSEKIRTYNFQRGEVNDHRLTSLVVKECCDEFLRSGESLINSIWEPLAYARENELIAELVDEAKNGV